MSRFPSGGGTGLLGPEESLARRPPVFHRLVRAVELEEELTLQEPWSPDALAGRLVELIGEGRLTVACRLVREMQIRREPVVWIEACRAGFFPPDVAANGVELEALPVVRLALFQEVEGKEPRIIGGIEGRWRRSSPTVTGVRAARVADRLLRSGAFALVVIDQGEGVHLGASAQTRLAQLARRHDAVLLVLSPKLPRGGSSLVSLRGRARRRRLEAALYRCEVCAFKDKRRAPGWRHAEVCRGPAGLH